METFIYIDRYSAMSGKSGRFRALLSITRAGESWGKHPLVGFDPFQNPSTEQVNTVRYQIHYIRMFIENWNCIVNM